MSQGASLLVSCRLAIIWCAWCFIIKANQFLKILHDLMKPYNSWMFRKDRLFMLDL